MDDIAEYNEWVYNHEDEILNAYIEQLEFDQIPNEYIQDYCEIKHMEDLK